jgi:hypothetical protein
MSELISAPERMAGLLANLPPRQKRHGWLALAAICMLASCKPADIADGSQAPHYGKPGQTYPRSAVAALSVTSAAVQTGKTPYQSAVNCAAAILTTKAALASSTVSLGAAGEEALDHVVAIFASQAKKLDPERATEDISNRQVAVADQAAEQTELTLSCIRQSAQAPQ